LCWLSLIRANKRLSTLVGRGGDCVQQDAVRCLHEDAWAWAYIQSFCECATPEHTFIPQAPEVGDSGRDCWAHSSFI